MYIYIYIYISTAILSYDRHKTTLNHVLPPCGSNQSYIFFYEYDATARLPFTIAESEGIDENHLIDSQVNMTYEKNETRRDLDRECQQRKRDRVNKSCMDSNEIDETDKIDIIDLS